MRSDRLKKDEVSKGLAESELAASCQSGVNDAGTCAPRDTGLTQPRSGFDLEDTRRKLIARRVRAGADTPEGHACSTLAEQLPNLVGYVRPLWATYPCQTLGWAVQQQMKRLERRT